MEETNPSQPRQKTMTYLHRCYSAALQQLKEGKLNEGVHQLQAILSHEFMSDTDMENLKYSALMSLANIHQQTQQHSHALSMYWQALQILTNRSQSTLQQGIFNLNQFNQERTHSQFTILLKMLNITQKQQMLQQTIFILKRAITLSPAIWRQNLINKLRNIYISQNMMEALNDLDMLMANKKKLQEVLAQNILPEKQKSRLVQVEDSRIEPEIQYARKITLKFNILQKEEHKVKYSSWQHLLTMMYILLKCQMPRCFNKKKYKKLEESKEWATLLKEYNPLRTNIEIILVQQQETDNKMEVQQPDGEKDYQIINFLASQILKAQFIKKKTKKSSNALEQLTRNPSQNSKDSKKQSITQTKSIYPSINQYYKDNFSKNGFQKQLLGNVKFLNEEKFNQILGKAYYDMDPFQPKKDEDIDDEQEDRSAPSNPQNKEKTKQKKGPKARKLQKIAQNERLGNQLKNTYFRNGTLFFNNIYEAVENITYFIVDNKTQSSTQTPSILSNQSIRKCLAKIILKVIQSLCGLFSQLIHPRSISQQKLYFLQILLQKVQQLTEKECKNKQFKQYQQLKRQKLISYIKQHYTISTLETKQVLQQNEIQIEKIQYYSTLCLKFVRVNYVYGCVKLSQVAYYRKLYAAFKRKLKQQYQNEDIFEKKSLDYVDLQIQKYQKKISKLKFIAITQEQEVKSSQSIDDIFKKDQQLSSALPLLKFFNTNNNQSKASKGNQMVEEVNILAYLQSFIRLSQIFYKKLQMQSTKEFNSRILCLLADLMKLKQVIGDIYEKILHNTSLKIYELNPQIFTPVLYHLLRIYLLNIYQQNDNCIRIIFYISNIIFRSLPESSKLIVVPKCIILYDQLIKYKKFKPDLINIIRKKFYQNLILKNLTFLFQSPLFQIQQGSPSKKKKKHRKNSSKSQSDGMSEKTPQEIHDENIEIKQKINDILHEIYFCPNKERQFNPRKIDEAIGYFMYLLKAFHDQFYCQVVELQYQVSKIIKKCYKIYTQKRGELFQYCQRFKQFKVLFQTVMNGDENINLKQTLISIIKRQQLICECCSIMRQKFPYCIQSLFLLGKFFEAQSLKDDITIDKDQWLQDLNKDESYYFEYLSLNLDSQIAWENIIRINANKSYMYFDSLFDKPHQDYKGKFLYTKRIIQYVNEHLPSFKKIIECGNQKSQILNAIKIKERQYLTLLKEIQVQQSPKDGKQCKEYKDTYKKYKEGLRKIEQNQHKIAFDDVKIRYIRVIQVKMKIFWINLESQPKQQKKNIIQLDNEDKIQPSSNRSSKLILQITDILTQIQSIINDLPIQDKIDYVIHLQEALAVQAYMFLYSNIDAKIQKMISSICGLLISATEQERSRNLKQCQQHFNQLTYINSFFQQRALIINEKYKIKPQSLTLEKSQIEKCSSSFESLFPKNSRSETKAQSKIKAIQKIKQKKEVIIINDDEKKMKQQELIVQLPIKQSSEKEPQKDTGKNKELVIDIANYCTEKIKKQMKRTISKNLTKLKSFVLSKHFLETIQKTSKIISQLIKFYTQLPKFQAMKRYKNRRSVGNGLLQCSQIILKYTQMPDKAHQIIKQLYNFKNDELVVINIHNQKIGTEKNQLLSQYYNRVLVHQTIKIRFIQHLFKIFEAQGNKDNLVALARKLLRLRKGADKQSAKQKDKQKSKQKNKPNKQVIQIDIEVKEGEEVKQPEKQKKPKGPKQKEEKQQQIKCYFLLYCQAASAFVNIIRAQTQKQLVNQKYEKNILEFKQRIKRSVDKNEINYYLKKLDDFIVWYQEKYNKKIKMKRSKAQMQNSIAG